MFSSFGKGISRYLTLLSLSSDIYILPLTPCFCLSPSSVLPDRSVLKIAFEAWAEDLCSPSSPFGFDESRMGQERQHLRSS